MACDHAAYRLDGVIQGVESMKENPFEEWATAIGRAVTEGIMECRQAQSLVIHCEMNAGDDAAEVIVQPDYKVIVMRDGKLYSTKDREWKA